MTPKFELGRDFSTMHLHPKFHHPTEWDVKPYTLTLSSYVYLFGRYRVDKHTYK